jgi:hypothetical protein
VFSRGNRRCSVNLVRIGIHPAESLIFHVIGCLLRDLAAEVALDDAEREVNAGGKSAGRSQISIFHEPRSALEMDIRKLIGKRNKRTVICGRCFARQKTGLCQHKCASANRHGHVVSPCRFTNPFQRCLTRFTLGRDNDYFRSRSISKCIIRDNFHPAACMDGRSRFGHGIKAERMIRPSRNHDILKNFPGPGEIDHYRAFRNKKSNGYAALGRRLERVCFDRGLIAFRRGGNFSRA